MNHGGAGDRGSGTVLVLVAAAVLMTVTGVLVSAGRVSLVRQRAATAADLAALAAASGSVTPTERCARAARIAAANNADVTACAVNGEDVVVRVEAGLPAGLGWLARNVTANSRAGPGP